MIGQGFDLITTPGWRTSELLVLALGVMGAAAGQGVTGLIRNFANEFLAQRIERDTRDELYVSLLGKSQTFHGRQRIGDIMARATNDVRMLNLMFSPGLMLIIDSLMAIVVPIVVIGQHRSASCCWSRSSSPSLLVITVCDYNRRLKPVSMAQREQFGTMNAGLAEADRRHRGGQGQRPGAARVGQVSPRRPPVPRLLRAAGRDPGPLPAHADVQHLPGLAAFCTRCCSGAAGALTLGQVVTFMGLLGTLRFPTFISIFTFNLVQLGIASAERILELINTETELDENEAGVARPMRGEVIFENVSFGYNGKPVLKDISFHAPAGRDHRHRRADRLGQDHADPADQPHLRRRRRAGAGRRRGRARLEPGVAALADLDHRAGRLPLLPHPGREHRLWLRRRRPGGDRAGGARGAGPRVHHRAFSEGYETEVGERGVTLSGGQRQRIAIARAFLTDPRILILDDTTSAIDSATEDQIQRAMRRISSERTTFLITHRLSQIRWADRILVLRRGELVDQGTHEELMATQRGLPAHLCAV